MILYGNSDSPSDLNLKYENLSTLLWLICYSVKEGSVSPWKKKEKKKKKKFAPTLLIIHLKLWLPADYSYLLVGELNYCQNWSQIFNKKNKEHMHNRVYILGSLQVEYFC